MATRSQMRSTSARMWVETTTVALPRSRAITSSTSRRPSGSRELTGSSSSSTLGRCTIACAIPGRCCMPPE